MTKAFVFDTETTGFVKTRAIRLERQPHLVEFYGRRVNLKTGRRGKETWMLCKPPIEVPEQAIKVHQITNEMLEGEEPFKHYAKQIIKEIESADLVIAHNFSFDRDVVEIELERLGLKVKWPRSICTVEQTMGVKGYRLNLQALHEFCTGEGFDLAHRANVDTEALIKCCINLYERGMIK